jgi:hypothetical protein
MKDKVSIARVETLHPAVKDDFIKFIEDAEAGLDITLRVTQAMRTFKEQADLYAKGRTTQGPKVTNAKPGSSYHNYGLAIDLVVMNGNKPDWQYNMGNLLPYAKKYGINWGGNFLRFKDYPHFEKPLGNNWRTLLARYNEKDFIPETVFVKL